MNNFDIFSNEVQNVLEFSSKLFFDGDSYSQINAASSTLSSIITINKVHCEKYLDVKTFMKGILELQLTFPKYHMIWDVSKVFDSFMTEAVII